MLGSASEAEDAVQESRIRLGRPDVNDVENLRAWLTTVVARVCLDTLRTRTSRREDPLDENAEYATDVGVNTMVGKTSKKSAKVAKKAAAKRVAAKAAKPRKTGPKSQSRKVAKPALLAGGNPQIAKAEGDVPVQAYIAAMPGWKRDVGRRFDALIARTVPDVRKAVKWNSPFYGIEGQGWFLNFHCFTKYVKVAFFRGTSLRPLPPGKSKHKDVRYLDIHEDDQLDEELMPSWIRQASELPGWVP
jgi:hypothetical protein